MCLTGVSGRSKHELKVLSVSDGAVKRSAQVDSSWRGDAGRGEAKRRVRASFVSPATKICPVPEPDNSHRL